MAKINNADVIKEKQVMLHGKTLASLIESKLTGLTETRHFVRKYGCFSSSISNDAEFMKQVLCTPSEYMTYVESLIIKQKEPKTFIAMVPVNIDCVDECANSLPDIISEDQLSNITEQSYRNNYELVTPPSIEYNEEDNSISIKGEVKEYGVGTILEEETCNRTFEIKCKVSRENNALAFTTTYNSSTAQTLAKKIISEVVKNEKHNGHVDFKAQIERIHFNSFDDERRVNFLLALKTSFCDSVYAGIVTDINVDVQDSEELKNDPQFKWASGAVNKMSLSGSDMDKFLSMVQSDYYRNFQIKEITVEYKVDPGAKHAITGLHYDVIRCTYTFKRNEKLSSDPDATLSWTPYCNPLPNAVRNMKEETYIKEKVCEQVIRLFHANSGK